METTNVVESNFSRPRPKQGQTKERPNPDQCEIVKTQKGNKQKNFAEIISPAWVKTNKGGPCGKNLSILSIFFLSNGV